jgi:sarcosine oxidase subunit gamma
MAEARAAWKPRGAWDGIAVAGRYGAAGEPGIVLHPVGLRGVAAIAVSEGKRGRLAEAMAADFGVTLPDAPRVESGGGVELVWAGAGRWLALSRQRDLPAMLARRLAGIAAVADQSDARALMRVGGPRVREVLAKGCGIDLHPRAFGPGDAAATRIAHMDVHLWQADDAPTFCLAAPRSIAGSFAGWLFASAGEFGYEVRGEE